MKKILNNIRKADDSLNLKSKIINTVLIFIFGIALGMLSDRNIRFISINDDFDSLKHDNIMERLDVPLKNMMYDHIHMKLQRKLKSHLILIRKMDYM